MNIETNKNMSLNVRFDLTTVEKIKELFERAKMLKTDSPKDFGIPTNYIWESYGDFTDNNDPEGSLDIAVLTLQDTGTDIILYYAGNTVAYLFRLKNNCPIFCIKDNVKDYAELSSLVNEEIEFLKYLESRGVEDWELEKFNEQKETIKQVRKYFKD